MRLFSLTIFIFIFFLSCTQAKKHTEIKILAHYPSASGIEHYNNRFYIIGDDAKAVLILDDELNIKDSISIYSFDDYRFPKNIKPDLESITLLPVKEGYKLLIVGSGSLAPYRNIAWMIDPHTKQADSLRFDSLYHQLAFSHGIREVNVEGLCALPGGILLVNRGHLGYPENNLVFIASSIYADLNNAVAHLIPIKSSHNDSSAFAGISGLAYSAKSDRLFLSLSTELTASVYEDGEIGKSYLWIINGISEKLNQNNLAPDKIIDLEQLDSSFKKQKIESVCLVNEKKNEVQVGLVADNDDGSSTVFKLTINTN